jgi:hypothetical protein
MSIFEENMDLLKNDMVELGMVVKESTSMDSQHLGIQ